MNIIASPSPRGLRLSKGHPVASSTPNLQTDSMEKLNQRNQRIISLNLSGKKFKIDCYQLIQSNRQSFLTNFVTAKEAERKSLAEFYCSETNTYYFWRNPWIFELILRFHATGVLHCPPLICPAMFLEDLKFWEVSSDAVADCCRPRLNLPAEDDPTETEDLMANGRIAAMFRGRVGAETPEDDDFSSLICGATRRVLWPILERPGSSVLAKIFTVFSVGLIIVSVLTLVMGSMKQFQQENEPIDVLIYIEYVCVVWFTVEYFARLIVSPSKINFLKDILNIVDALSIFPFHVEFILIASGRVISADLKNVKGALLAMRILRVLRVARVFKLARYSVGLQSFIRTFASSHKELGMLMMFFSSSVLLFSTTVYFMEKDAENTPFISIPATFWWAIVTMTTVGYGDMIPVTIGGKLVASFATITGVIVLAFPITMIVENFCKHYEHDTSEQTRASDSPEANKRLRVKSAAII